MKKVSKYFQIFVPLPQKLRGDASNRKERTNANSTLCVGL